MDTAQMGGPVAFSICIRGFLIVYLYLISLWSLNGYIIRYKRTILMFLSMFLLIHFETFNVSTQILKFDLSISNFRFYMCLYIIIIIEFGRNN